MIGLDTNVIVRYVVQDDPDQAALATKTMESLTDQEPGFVSVVTVAEISWVLRRAYRLELNAVLDVIEGLINVRELRVEGVDAIRRAVDRARAGGEFADCLIAELGHAAGCATTLTFDRGAAGQSGMSLIG
ncbi:MAG: type II toxin-antitoxin system VapC family toxin [Micropruina sp.]